MDPPTPPGQPLYPPPGPPSYPPPPPRRNRGPVVRLLVILAVIFVIGVGFFLFRDRLSGNANSLQVGDCIDTPSSSSSIRDVQHQPCNAAHDSEVFALVTDSGSGDYPGADHFHALATQQCIPAAAAYLDVAEVASRTDIDAGYFYPLIDSWSSGDHRVTCYLYRIDGQQLTVSLHGIGASPLP